MFIECAVNYVVKHYVVCLPWLSPSGSKPAATGAIKRITRNATELHKNMENHRNPKDGY